MITLALVMLLGAAVDIPATDFGIRSVQRPAPATSSPVTTRRQLPLGTVRFNLAAAAGVARSYGRVTSTIRSAERNRRVGGVPNSWHLLGRAMDVARSPSVSHAALAAELRRRGYHLIESLDEGDHSHFAFSDGAVTPRQRSRTDQLAEVSREADYFRFVTMPVTSSDRQTASLR
ncbi:D-Ala-D-Ala carboxypeptidase family metallohydrolase [Sphingomonas glaciei]|uniref:D-Ala-D-Ala carboxypeptidase family metallohydrolase n=1 Tax=Sphingomonas glaciei TaxID=2938948 RepID=A0ABY5MX26_9SPHN|nr:D-Ala-D-Ala carboxypeptidase family metallohydrolase [Sphingomonas glaciei]UUR08325.1 D-Ala-D-Ala carboxypeptidase family metallohydrolase [Sphingomonas glaciei]